MGEVNLSKQEFLRRFYRDPQQPGSLGGIRRLYDAAKAIRPDISLKDVEKFMQDSRTYTLHKLQPKKFKRRAILSPKPRVILGADLADMRLLAKYNRGYNYILVCIDIFSRYAKAIPLKRKDAKSMVVAMKQVLEEDDVFKGVSRFFVDRGKEFYNQPLRTYLESRGVKTYSVYSQETKCSIAERFIRTLKGRLYRFMTERNSLEYVSALQSIVQSYNHTTHSTLGKKTPSEVHTLRNPQKIRDQFRVIGYKRGESRSRKFSRSLRVGDYVRLAGAERASKFSRGFHIQNTEEIFRISNIDRRQRPVCYHLHDLTGDTILGCVYREELIKVTLPEVFPITIKKSRIVNGRKQFYVSWLGYDTTQDQWIDATDIS